MKNRKIIFVLIIVFIGLFALASCESNTPHVDNCNHNYEEWVVIDEATCSEKGLRIRTCSICGNEDREDLPVLEHTITIDFAKDATCTVDGLSEGQHCSVCGDVLITQEVIPALGHTEVFDAAVEPCVTPGLTEGKHCSVCSEALVAQTVIPATGNHIEVVISGTEPTCTADGLTDGKRCTACEEIFVKQEVIPALGHTEVLDSGVKATCTDPGLTDGKHCEVCETVLLSQQVIPALGHTEVIDRAVSPCVRTGLTEGKHCSECGEVFVEQQIIPALGYHVEIIDSAVTVTCTTDGRTEGKHCAVCNTVIIAQKIIPALGHTEVFDTGFKATCTTSGLTDGVHCAVCSKVLTAQTVIPAGHTEVIDGAVAPTCTETGLTEGKHCEVCETILLSQTVVPALGHTEVILPYVAPSCTKFGRTEGKRCSVCEKLLVPQDIIGKTAHSYGSWKLTVIPTDTEMGTEVRSCEVCGITDSHSVTWDTIDWTFLRIYNSRYGYNYLGTLDNGDNLQALYDEIDKYVRRFHFDTNLTATNNEIATINCKKFDTVHANIVLKVYSYDNPLYYWLSDAYYGLGYEFTLLTEGEYALGSVREKYNKLVLDSIEKYTSLVNGETSAYKIALIYHDAIVDAVDYADDNNIDAAWAHNILGVFTGKGAVCEGYAKTFQLLLNVSDVNNVYIVGQSGNTGHVWNLVKLDDGKWYWCDLTWDDGSNSYNYFCVGDTDSFLSEHTYGTTSFYSKHFLYELPNRSDKDYSA